MAIKKKTLNISRVAQEATQNFVAPKPLASNEAVRHKIVEETPAPKPLRRVCTIQKVGGFTFFTGEDDRNALDYIAFRQKYEKQNIVRAALTSSSSSTTKRGKALMQKQFVFSSSTRTASISGSERHACLRTSRGRVGECLVHESRHCRAIIQEPLSVWRVILHQTEWFLCFLGMF
ncbi:MAG: hypothetical protein IIW69_03230 [Bacteroidaceae bacterium]|nr:hypothetical protein [Bacteroidaceae bacterium]